MHAKKLLNRTSAVWLLHQLTKYEFSLQVIDYVKYLQEKVEKYEGRYPGRSSEPPKLMPLVDILFFSFCISKLLRSGLDDDLICLLAL